MEVDLYEDRNLSFEPQLRKLDLDDDDFIAAEQKDRICKHYARSKCNNIKCPDLHIKEKTTVCKHWLNSLCKKNRDCEFLHRYDLTRMPTCHFWTDYKECNNGADCVYLHLDEESTADECTAFLQGFCRLGPKCKLRHKKKPVCERYLVGFCPDGPSCKYGHPKFNPEKSGGLGF